MTTLPIPIRCTLTDGAKIPAPSTPKSSGLDLHMLAWKDRDERGFAAPDHEWRRGQLMICPGEIILVRTGVSVELPDWAEAQVRGRSGLASKHGIAVHNSPGTIDADYRGEIGVMLVHLGDARLLIQPGERVAQLVVASVVRVQLDVVEELGETTRGVGGFGSTGRL